MQKPITLGNGLTSINFIGEEITTFSGRFIKRGVLTKPDLQGIIEDIDERAARLTAITKALKAEHLN